MRITNKVYCQIRVLIKFEFHNPRLFYGSLFILVYRGTGTKRYYRIRGLYEISQFHNHISFPEFHFFLCGKVYWRMLKRLLYQIRVLIKFKFHNPDLFSGSLFILFYRGTGTKFYCWIRGLYETSQFYNPISFSELHFFVICGKGLKANVE